MGCSCCGDITEPPPQWVRDVIASQESRWPCRWEFDPLNQHIQRQTLREVCCSEMWSWTEGPASFSIRQKREKWLTPHRVGPQGQPLTDWEVSGAIVRALNAQSSHPRARSRHSVYDWSRLARGGDAWHYYYVAPGEYEDTWYVDLRAAYYSIYSAWRTWDVRYVPGEAFGWGEVPWPDGLLDWLNQPGQKRVRVGLIGVAGATTSQVHLPPDDRVIEVPVQGCTAYQSACAVLDYLQSVLWYAHRAFRGAVVYANTDCLAVKGELAARELQAYWAEVWGLESIVKAHGPATIDALGAYRIGDTISGHFGRIEAQGIQRAHARGLERIARFVYHEIRPLLLEVRRGKEERRTADRLGEGDSGG